MSSSTSLLHGAEFRKGVLVSGDSTVMAFCRHQNGSRGDNFVLIDVNDKELLCDESVTRWLPQAVNAHLNPPASGAAGNPKKNRSSSSY